MDDNAYAEKMGLCPKCKGRGFVLLDVPYGHPEFGKLIRCECIGGSRPAASPFQDVEIPRDVLEATFASVRRRPEIAQALPLAKSLVKQGSGLLTLWGPPGAGKSEVLGCVYNHELARGRTCLYADAITLFRVLRKRFDAGSGLRFDDAWEWVLSVEVLCLDDLQALSQTPWAAERVVEVVNARYNHRHDRLTCLATNDDIDNFPDFVRSRLCDRQCYQVHVTGSDARQRKR